MGAQDNQLINSDRISNDTIRKFDDAVEKLKHEIFQSLQNDESSPDDCSSSDCDRKPTSINNATSVKKDEILTDNILEGHFEMACDESKWKKREERRKNGLG